MKFAAALLAGGRSTRMGQDKAWLPWKGEPLAWHQVRTLRDAGAEIVIISARQDQEFDGGDKWLFEKVDLFLFDPLDSNHGPLGGIARCLQTTLMPTLVLAVDMPDMTATFLRERLIAPFAERCEQDQEDFTESAADISRPGLVFRGPHGFEPLAAMYTPAILPLLEQALSEQRLSLQELIRAAIQQGLMQAIDVRSEDEPYFRNLNTPADLAEDRFAAAIPLLRLRRDAGAQPADDLAAREEPLEIRVGGRNVAVVMRTPGHDRELAAGFLFSEGVVRSGDQILDIIKCPGTGRSKGNIVDVLVGNAEVDWASLTRHVFSASSCGLCGKTSIESVFQRFPPLNNNDSQTTPELLWSLADKVRAAQDTFSKTGGLHACAIFDLDANPILLREDVGRHNALDKVLGHALLHGLLPFDRHVLFLSGRVSFEMMQKALAAQVPIVAAISAPTSLAVQFAQDSNQTLIGFLRDPTMNVYTHARRINCGIPFTTS